MNQTPKLTTRAEAQVQGLTRYFTGEPCEQGHVGERFTRDYSCVTCYKLRRLRRRERQSLERIKARHKFEALVE